MLGKLFEIIDKYRDGRESRRILNLPAVKHAIDYIHLYWTDNEEVVKDFSPGFVASEGEAMLQKVIQVVLSEDPRMANRELLCNYMVGYAAFQVLVIDPPPAEDPTGLRGVYGISGELKARLVEIAHKHEDLVEYMHQFPEVKTFDDVWNPVLFRYRVNYAWMHVFHMLRLEFKDTNLERDWYKPFVFCMCAWQEQRIRKSLDLPSLIDSDPFEASMRALMLSSFMNRVMEGHQFPDLEWQRTINETQFKDLKLMYAK